jgi:hypothetical protein
MNDHAIAVFMISFRMAVFGNVKHVMKVRPIFWRMVDVMAMMDTVERVVRDGLAMRYRPSCPMDMGLSVRVHL